MQFLLWFWRFSRLVEWLDVRLAAERVRSRCWSFRDLMCLVPFKDVAAFMHTLTSGLPPVMTTYLFGSLCSLPSSENFIGLKA